MKNENLGVIFDMDGVLAGTERAMKDASIKSLERFGIHPKYEDFLEFTGMGEDMFIGGVARKYGLEYNPEMKLYAYDLYKKDAKKTVIIFPGEKEMLARLRAAGFKIAVASAADWTKVEKNIECIGVTPDFFDAVVSGTDVTHNKPDPEIFLKAAQKLGIEPCRCIVTEDALSGIRAAKAARMASIGVTTSFDRKTLSEVHPDYILDHIADADRAILDWSAKLSEKE